MRSSSPSAEKRASTPGSALPMLPGLGAASVSVERETNTYEQLRLTLFSTRSIVFAKLVNVVGFFVLLLAAAVPVMSVALLLVGMDFTELLVDIVKILVQLSYARPSGC